MSLHHASLAPRREMDSLSYAGNDCCAAASMSSAGCLSACARAAQFASRQGFSRSGPLAGEGARFLRHHSQRLVRTRAGTARDTPTDVFSRRSVRSASPWITALCHSRGLTRLATSFIIVRVETSVAKIPFRHPSPAAHPFL